jgi:hypothetical protein
LPCQLVIVRSGQWADVARRARLVLGELGAPATTVDPGHRVELPAVEVGRVDVQDGTGVVQEGVLVAHLGFEPELVGDVRLTVAVVVDVDLVEHVVTELEEVRATGGSL